MGRREAERDRDCHSNSKEDLNPGSLLVSCPVRGCLLTNVMFFHYHSQQSRGQYFSFSYFNTSVIKIQVVVNDILLFLTAIMIQLPFYKKIGKAPALTLAKLNFGTLEENQKYSFNLQDRNECRNRWKRLGSNGLSSRWNSEVNYLCIFPNLA